MTGRIEWVLCYQRSSGDMYPITVEAVVASVDGKTSVRPGHVVALLDQWLLLSVRVFDFDAKCERGWCEAWCPATGQAIVLDGLPRRMTGCGDRAYGVDTDGDGVWLAEIHPTHNRPTTQVRELLHVSPGQDLHLVCDGSRVYALTALPLEHQDRRSLVDLFAPRGTAAIDLWEEGGLWRDQRVEFVVRPNRRGIFWTAPPDPKLYPKLKSESDVAVLENGAISRFTVDTDGAEILPNGYLIRKRGWLRGRSFEFAPLENLGDRRSARFRSKPYDIARVGEHTLATGNGGWLQHVGCCDTKLVRTEVLGHICRNQEGGGYSDIDDSARFMLPVEELGGEA